MKLFIIFILTLTSINAADENFYLDANGITIHCENAQVGESGTVEGQIVCQSADISGKAKVKMEVSDLTILRATSQFLGDIITKKISIESGAEFSGSCQMTTSATNSAPTLHKPKT